MKIKGYSIYDTKAEAYSPPVFQTTEGFAVRSFEKAVTDESSEWSKNPEDYSLHLTSEFDDQSGQTQQMVPVHIIGGLEAVRNVLMRNRKLRDLQKQIEEVSNPETEES